MRILLDTNIIIHRENKRVSNYSIGHLFRWIDKLKYDKVIHPYTVSEIQKYRDPETQETISVKLESYDVIKTVRQPDAAFLSKIGQPEKNENDHIDNCLLYEVYLGRVDILITEDRIKRSPSKKSILEMLIARISFLTVFGVHMLDLIGGSLVSVTKKHISAAQTTTEYWAFCI